MGPATKLAFTTNPSASTGGTAFGTQPVVKVQDAGVNTVTSSSAPITLSITFAGCKIDKIGTYTLTATASGLTAAVSAIFTIT